jgi:hypothetical protein
MSWKRILVSVPLGFLIMITDGGSLIVVNRLYRAGYPPGWVSGLFFYFDAWPVMITQHIFPRASRDTFGGPTFLAIAAGALIDLIIFTAIVYALLTWRARRKSRA